MTTKPRSHRLLRIDTITERHHGCMVEVAGLVGTLIGIIPLGDRRSLVLQVGKSTAWTDWLPGDTDVEVWRAEA